MARGTHCRRPRPRGAALGDRARARAASCNLRHGLRVSRISPMTLGHKIVNLIAVPTPLVGLIAAIVLLWNRAIGPLELGLMAGFYVITCMGVTLGYHRMFTHRAFEGSRAFRAIIAIIGSMAVEGSVITWVADHRKHHAFTDREGA